MNITSHLLQTEIKFKDENIRNPALIKFPAQEIYEIANCLTSRCFRFIRSLPFLCIFESTSRFEYPEKGFKNRLINTVKEHW